jgi:5-methylcytosine-specific restriction endonuclease McrA
MVYLSLSQASRKAFLFPANARQSVYASGACDKELETNRLAGFCVEAEMKRCNVCGELKLLSEFHKHKLMKDGCANDCKDCSRRRASEWRIKNPERASARKKSWGERNKEWVAAKKREWERNNREKKNRRQRERRLADIDEARKKQTALRQAWRKKHPEKDAEYTHNRRFLVLGNGGNIAAQEWKALKEFYNHTCLCFGKQEPEIKLTLDHVTPLILGGTNTIDNVQPLCQSCNSRKSRKIIDYRKEKI